jgi:hypothetical protein
MELPEVVKDVYQKQQTRIEPELCLSHSYARFVFTAACLVFTSACLVCTAACLVFTAACLVCTAACLVISFCRTERYVLLCGRLSEIQRFLGSGNSHYVY